jgi:hypothetical protein
MKLHICAAMAAVLALGACAAGSGTTTPADPVTTALDAAKKVVTVGHLGHQAAADIADTGARSGLLKGANAATAQSWLDQSEADLGTADAAIAAGDAATATAQAAAATALISKVEALAASPH